MPSVCLTRRAAPRPRRTRLTSFGDPIPLSSGLLIERSTLSSSCSRHLEPGCSYTLRLVTCQSCTAHTPGQDYSYRLMGVIGVQAGLVLLRISIGIRCPRPGDAGRRPRHLPAGRFPERRPIWSVQASAVILVSPGGSFSQEDLSPAFPCRAGMCTFDQIREQL